MKEVGDKFGAGELILPFVLQSAEVIKKCVTHLENYLEKIEGVSKGLIVLATVYGDVHDIGKNLVKTILANNGYMVVDLGKQVPAEAIIFKAAEVNATAIGLSALLVNTSKQMPLIINELHRRGLKFPVLVGGAAINRRFGRRILFTEAGEPYEPGVFYCKDAFEGLETMDALSDPQKRESLLKRIRSKADMEMGRTLHSIKVGTFEGCPRANRPSPKTWGAIGERYAAGNHLPAPVHKRTIPPLMGRKERPRPGVGEVESRVRFSARAYETRGDERRLAQAPGCLWIHPLSIRWQRAYHLRPRSHPCFT
jgi:5-methyltetrahydrofolate--homocysteine methyltransferase